MVRSRCTKTVCLRCATWNHRDTIAQLLFTALSSGKSFWKILRFVSAYRARAIFFQKFLQRELFRSIFPKQYSNEYHRYYPPLPCVITYTHHFFFLLNIPNSQWSKFVATDGAQSYKITKASEQATNKKKTKGKKRRRERRREKAANYREVSGQSIP